MVLEVISINSIVRIMIVDDHTLFRSGLKMLLENQKDMLIVAESSSAEEALTLTKEHDIDIVLMDISLRGMDGLEAAKLMKQEYPSLKIIAVTMHNDEPYLLKALEAGITGYVLKEAATTELAAAIRSVMAGKINIHPSLMKILVDKAINQKTVEKKEESQQKEILTKRENEVLHYICLGYTNQEIANILVISVKTVEKHKEHIMEKLNLKKRHQLIKYALEKGLVTLEDKQ